MKNKPNYAFFLLVVLGTLYSCSNNDNNINIDDFVVGFENPSEDLSHINGQKTITLSFSKAAPEQGIIHLSYAPQNLKYGKENDFTTNPSGEEGSIAVPVKQDSASASLTIHKFSKALPEEKKSILFTIDNIELGTGDHLTYGASGGNTSTTVNFSKSASLGGELKPEVGGPNEPYQVYVNLKSKEQTQVQRDSWDLGFYAGNEFRIKLNSSLKMFAAATTYTNIDKVNEDNIEELMPKMALLSPGSDQFVDDPSGNINKTAINEPVDKASKNPVYLINLGDQLGEETPETGSVAVDKSDPDEPEKGKRGWKKIKILKKDDHYILQYANLEESSHHEVTIPKTPNYNFVFFSFTTNEIVDVEPQKSNWDLNFTTFTNTLELPGDIGDGKSAYGYSDFVVTNRLGGVQAYQISTDEISYEDFSKDKIEQKKMEKDQRVIGDGWRDVFEHAPTSDVFYAIQDAEGNLYKLKFTALVNEDGERGYPAFEYALLK